ncbi:hypothetical protein BSEPE_0112 [endosymbiont of Bathymodiolus septemdierum str. Myojin knoll]|uniref:Uncharacterized protein n=2 Tax=sulfur-oxidizing symbionts TaxID=32036 RepID=A0A0P0UQ10_9GAMM|nr:hypothetical protein BSEPE_0112 [endosymbiont of Bathymodiolus septemdierum str. Myojin knoll]
MKKFNQNNFIKRLSENIMSEAEFDQWMDNEKNWNDNRTRNNTRKHADTHWNKIRRVFNEAHKNHNTANPDEENQLNKNFLNKRIGLEEYFNRLKNGPMSDETFKKICSSDNTSSEFNEYKKNGEKNKNKKVVFYNLIRKYINHIYKKQI